MDIPSMPLQQILSNLTDIADGVRTNPRFCQNMKQQLMKCGYDWFDDISNEHKVKEQVMKVLAVAVNEAIQKKVDFNVDLSLGDIGEVNQELHQLLDIPEDKSLDDYFSLKIWSLINNLVEATSPLDMAEYLKRSAPQWLVKNIIQYQFHMRWHTHGGEPHDYTFYQFCDKAGGEGEFNEVDIDNDWSWIDPSIRKFITENADEQKVESVQSLEDSLAKPTLYWAVLNDGEFYSGDSLRLQEIGRTQVYVGKANNGIRGRWIKDKDNHCAMMKKCLDNVCAMTTYDPSTLEGIQLVDARLALAKVRRDHAKEYRLMKSGDDFPENSALFVIKTFGDDVEKAEIAQQNAQVRLDKAQRDVDKAQANWPETRSVAYSRLQQLKAEVEERQEELYFEAIAVVNDTKTLTISKEEAETQLKQAEKQHRKGKRVHEVWKNIIPHKDCNISWKPTDMGYGMNCH
ncbi:Hypothetical predicted protein [Paramuricea clavata]|uniref:Uncharacterized protein n=1 Tax=Paramuricea clavata TaxID=317549 RepID=A0A7D9HBZ6_PARCT|nr:Hypothetical predicted protein [Paramuricea clavata]